MIGLLLSSICLPGQAPVGALIRDPVQTNMDPRSKSRYASKDASASKPGKTGSYLILDPFRKIPITLSSTDMNRIALKNGRISDMWGADLFTVELDNKLGQVFLHAKQGMVMPENLSMAFTTEDGMTQDLFVTFNDAVSKPVIFDVAPVKDSLRRRAHRFFYDVLSGQTERFVEQTSGASKDLCFGRMKFLKRIVSKDFAVDIFEVTATKKNRIYHLSHRFFLSSGCCGVWLSDTKLTVKRPVIVAKLKLRSGSRNKCEIEN